MIVIIMGVSGSGKTTVGKVLAASLAAEFIDADDFHAEAGIEQMRSGTALTDRDRAGWLDRLRARIDARLDAGSGAVLACSALSRWSRERLGTARKEVRIVCLTGAEGLIAARMQGRQHFMPASLLASQLAELEVPPEALVLDVAAEPATLVTEIRAWLGTHDDSA
jgi:gluconokinase